MRNVRFNTPTYSSSPVGVRNGSPAQDTGIKVLEKWYYTADFKYIRYKY